MTKYVNKLILVLILVPLVSYAGESPKQVELIISTGYPPYYYNVNSEKPEGVCIDIVEAAAQALNIKIVYKVFPWSKCLKEIEHGRADAMLPLLKTADRERYLYYFEGNALAKEANVFMTLQGTPIDYSGNLNDLADYKIGFTRNYSYGKAFDSANFLIKEPAKNDILLLKKLLSRKQDIIIGNEYVLKYQAHLLGMSNKIKQVGQPISEDPLYIVFSKPRKRQSLAQKFSNRLKEFKKSEKYNDILEKYGIK